MDLVFSLPLIIGFFIVLFSTHLWIKSAKRVGLVGKDMHKIDKKEIAEAGGIVVLFGFVLAVLIYVQIKVFYIGAESNLIEVFAALTSILIIGIVGFMDDLFGWKIGLTKKTRIVLLFFSAIPLIVINAGQSSMMGVEFGLLYPLLIIPIGIIGASTTFNFLAGYNGLETGQGIIILSGLTYVTYVTGSLWLSMISLIMIFCLLAFYIYNKNPSEVFPGDILTYSVGALIAIIAILGNIEKIAVLFFIPYAFEAGLKIRGKLKKESFGKLKEDGSLDEPYNKIYGLEHLAIKVLKKIKPNKKAFEKEVVYLINSFQIIVIILVLLIFL